MPLGGEAHNPESATGAGYVPYVGATATVDLGAQNMITTGEVQGINVTSGVDPGHTHSDYIPYTGATQAVDLGAFGVTADSLVLTNPLAVSYGGTGLSVGTQYALIYFSATDAIGMIGIGTPTYLLAVNATGDGYEWVAAPVPAVAFTDLTDVPNSYAGQGGKLVAVKADVSGLEFVSGSGGVTDHDLLNNLNWAAAGHTFDTNLVLGAFYAELEEIVTPATPSANLVRVYAKDNSGVSALYYITDDGTEVGPLGTGGGGGAVDSVFGRTGAVVAVTNDYTWAQIDKTISDLSDITTKSHTVLDDIGTNTHSTIDSHIADSTIHFVDAFVHLTGNESIDGLKTFTTLPQCSVVPTNDNDLVNKLYVDTFAQGLSVRESCSVATTANITLSGVQTIDGVLVSVGNRVLVKNQSIQANNGIYVVAAGAWSRALDYDASSEVQEGTFTAILLGTTNTGKLFVQITIDPTLGVSSLVFSQLSTPPVYTSDNGITRTTYNFQLGGTIIKDTVFTIVGANNIIFDLATSGATGDFLIRKVGTGNVFGVYENGNTGIGTTGAATYQLYIKPQVDNFIGLAIRSFSATQTANLQEWQTSTGSIKAYISPLGYLGVTQTNDQEITSSILGQQVASTLQSYTTGTTAETLDNTYEAWKITVATTLNIRSVGISIRYTTAVPTNPTAYIRLHIYNDDGGAPSKPSTLRTSASTYTYYGQLTASFATQQQNFAYALAAGTYWIVAQRSAAPTGGGTVDIQVNNAAVADTYAYATTPPTWTNESNKTPRYYIFGRTYYGVYGYSDSNYGVRGYSVNTYGGYFTSVNGVGVYAQGNTYGGYFLSAYSYAVYATSTYGSAIYGTTTTGYGVQGNSTSGTSIYGVTTTGIGIYGNTTSGRGVYAVSTTGTSLECVTTSGVGSIVTANPATTNIEHELQRWTRTTSATAAIGIGLRNNYYIEDVGGTSRNVGRMSVVLTDVTANATIADWYISLTNGSATLSEALRVKGSGISYFRTGVALLESGSTPTYYTILQSADLTGANYTYTLPASYPATSGYVLASTDAGVMSWFDTSVYLTVTDAGTTYVPYTGANADVDIGTQNLLFGTATGCSITNQTGTDLVITPPTGGLLTLNATNLVGIVNLASIRSSLDFSLVATADKTFTFPNLTGTIVTTVGAGANVSLGDYQLAVGIASASYTRIHSKGKASVIDDEAYTGSGLDDMDNGGTFTGAVDIDYEVQITGHNFTKVSDGGGGTLSIIETPDTTGLSTGNYVTITDITPPFSYSGNYQISSLIANTSFVITKKYTATAIGNWKRITSLTPPQDEYFDWSDDGGSTWDGEGVAITGSAQTLNNGVTVTFAAQRGHTYDDQWIFTAHAGYGPIKCENSAGDSLFNIYTDNTIVFNEAGLASANFRLEGNTVDLISTNAATDTITFGGYNQFNGNVLVGANDEGYPVIFYGDTAGKSWLWDDTTDTMTVTGISQFTGTLTVGVDDTGYDVKFYGATPGKYWEWDESADKMIIVGDVAVTGTSLFTGAVTIEGAVVINDTSADVDTRIESNGNAQMLFVDGGNDSVGIGTNAPSANVCLDMLTGYASRFGAFSASNGANSNINIGDASYVRITGPTGVFNITGIANPTDGKFVLLYNDTAYAMTITNDATSTDANRIFTLTGGDVTTTGTGQVALVYCAATDGGVGKWVMIAGLAQ